VLQCSYTAFVYSRHRFCQGDCCVALGLEAYNYPPEPFRPGGVFIRHFRTDGSFFRGPAPETHRPLPHIQDEGTIPAGFSPITVASHQCNTNGKSKEGTAWYSDGSKLEVPSLEGQMDRAGVALSCGPLIIIARVTGPQTSYRGELQGVALVTAPSLAEPGDTLTMDNQAVVRWAPDLPTRSVWIWIYDNRLLNIWVLDQCPILGSPATVACPKPRAQMIMRQYCAMMR